MQISGVVQQLAKLQKMNSSDKALFLIPSEGKRQDDDDDDGQEKKEIYISEQTF